MRSSLRCLLGMLITTVLAASTGCDEPTPEPAPGRYWAAQLQLHGSFSEGSGTMRGHNLAARRLGNVDVLWWTDHDWRIARHTYFDGYDFDSSEQRFAAPQRSAPWSKRRRGIRAGWVERAWGAELATTRAATTRRFVSQGSGALELTAVARSEEESWGWTGVSLEAPGGRFSASLASQPMLRLAVRVGTTDADAQLVIRLELSRQPEGLAELWYVITAGSEPLADAGEVRELSGRRIGIVPVTVAPGWWRDVVLRLTEDAQRLDLGGFDNSLRRIHIALRARRGAALTAQVDDLRILPAARGDNLLKRQREMAVELERDHGLVNHVGLEISYGLHMNAYLPEAELPDFRIHPNGLAPEEIAAWAHQRGGIVSYNHIFGASFEPLDEGFGEAEDDPEDGPGDDPEDDPEDGALGKAQRHKVEERIRAVIENGAYGADLLEVGYPNRVLPLEEHLAIWDRLSRRRIFLTATGASDSHDQLEGWESGNNFVTWIWAVSSSREDLIEGLRRGRAFFGDPARFRGTLDLESDQGHVMGQRIPADGARRGLRLRLSELPPESRVRWIVDGEVAREVRAPAGAFEDKFSVEAVAYRFVRAEVWNGGRGLVFSNCLVFEPAAAPESVR